MERERRGNRPGTETKAFRWLKSERMPRLAGSGAEDVLHVSAVGWARDGVVKKTKYCNDAAACQ